MDITIDKVLIEEKQVLGNLFEFYNYEFSKYLDSLELQDDGRFGFEPLDSYLSEPHFYPYFIRVNNRLAGFVIVKSEDKNGVSFNSIEQFFVMKKYEGKGIGKYVAKEIFDRFPGEWKVTQVQKNYPAQAFWRSTINEYTKGDYREYYDERRRSVQEFRNIKI
jgi:predicted acetyltransferase